MSKCWKSSVIPITSGTRTRSASCKSSSPVWSPCMTTMVRAFEFEKADIPILQIGYVIARSERM
jgi:hypothetical protein